MPASAAGRTPPNLFFFSKKLGNAGKTAQHAILFFAEETESLPVAQV